MSRSLELVAALVTVIAISALYTGGAFYLGVPLPRARWGTGSG